MMKDTVDERMISENTYRNLKEVKVDATAILDKYLSKEEINELGIQSSFLQEEGITIGTYSSFAYYLNNTTSKKYLPKSLDTLNDWNEIQDKNILLQSKYVFLGLNAGLAAEGKDYRTFEFFHDPGTRISKFMQIFKDERFNGAYQTDAYKALPTSDGSELNKLVSEIEVRLNLEVDDLYKRLAQAFYELLKYELDLFENEDITIIAFGGVNQDSSAMSRFIDYSGIEVDYPIVRIPHYSAGTTKIKDVFELLSNLN